MAKSKYTFDEIEELLDKIHKLPNYEELSKLITDKILLSLDISEAFDLPTEENPPEIILQQKLEDWGRNYTMVLKRLRGPKGDPGSLQNIIMSEQAYQRLEEKERDKFYYTYDESVVPEDTIEGSVLQTSDVVESNVLQSRYLVNNHILSI